MKQAVCIDLPIEDSAANGELLGSKYLSGWRPVREYDECSVEMRESVKTQIENVIKLSNEEMNVAVHYMLREDPYREWQRIENSPIESKVKHFRQYIAQTEPLDLAKDVALGTLTGFGYMILFFYAIAFITEIVTKVRERFGW